MGISFAGVFRMEGMSSGVESEGRRGVLYPYQPEFSVLCSDCFRISFQSGAVFCSSQEMRGFPCQETANRTPELEFNVYHRI